MVAFSGSIEVDNLAFAKVEPPYTETNLISSYSIIVRYLNQVGLAHADPMECPLVTQLRPR